MQTIKKMKLKNRPLTFEEVKYLVEHKGDITIPKGSYKGSGDAILFIRKDNNSICDKVLYFIDIDGVEYDIEGNLINLPNYVEIEIDEDHYPVKAMISCWEAVVPSQKSSFVLLISQLIPVLSHITKQRVKYFFNYFCFGINCR